MKIAILGDIGKMGEGFAYRYNKISNLDLCSDCDGLIYSDDIEAKNESHNVESLTVDIGIKFT